MQVWPDSCLNVHDDCIGVTVGSTCSAHSATFVTSPQAGCHESSKRESVMPMSLPVPSYTLTLSYVADEREPVTVRLSVEAMTRVRTLALTASTPDHRITTSDVIRMALSAGLPGVERKLGKQR